MKPPVLDDGAELWRTVPSEVSPIGVSLCFPSDLHRCHMSQQSTWIALVPFVEIKSQHWLYSSAIDPLILSPWNTHCHFNAVRHFAYTVSVEQTLLMKGRLAYDPQCRRLSQK